MRADPVRQRLGPARFRIGVVRRAKRRDKDTRTMLGARDGIEYRDGIASPIDEQLLAGQMRLAHRRRDALAPGTVPLAEPAVGVAFGVLASILLPEQRQRHAPPLHLRMDVRPVRIGARRRRTCVPRRKQPPLQIGIIDRVRDRPAQTRHGRAAHVLAHRRFADPRRLADQPRTHPQRMRQTQHLTYLPHRHSLCWHRSLPGCQGDRSADSIVDGSDA